MTEPSPYEHGFRDGLLTAHASLVARSRECIGIREGVGSYFAPQPVDALPLIAQDITALLDQKNHDLYNLLAIAQVDLSRHPEAQALRSMLRAPTGLLIDGEGRVLFIRLNGTEYETGVMGLLEEVERLKAAENAGKDLGPQP